MTDDHQLPRSIALEGTSNLRDLGGWPAAEGGRVRFGAVFRSAALGRLTDADGAILAATGLRTVVDLRSDQEREQAPSRLHALPGVALHALPIDISLGIPLRDVVAAGSAKAMVLMRRAYVAYALEWSHRYAALFDLLLHETRRPLLFHCTAGKDRTGFGAALLLAALGVPPDSIRADYLATNRLWQGEPEIEALLPPAVAEVLLRVHDDLLDVAFAAIRTAHGSVDAYLTRCIGLDEARRDRLRCALLI